MFETDPTVRALLRAMEEAVKFDRQDLLEKEALALADYLVRRRKR